MRFYDETLKIYYEINNEEASIVDADKNITDVIICEGALNNICITNIKKKAFLGCKQLRSVTLPETVRSVGDWAFAHCDALTDFNLASDTCVFGQGVFKNDASLTSFSIEGRSRDAARLLAKAVTVMEAEYLLDTEAVGSSAWIEKWDRKLENILNTADDDGYHLYVLCGEEDLHFDYDEYLEYNKRKKSGLCMLRLLYDEELAGAFRERLSAYVREHAVGMASEAAWNYVVSEHGDDIEYYELLLQLGGIDEGNLERALGALSDRHAEAKAFLINAFHAGDKTGDFFDSLLL